MVDKGPPTLGVGMVGYAFMGAAHSQAWRSAARFFDLPLTPAMVALAGRDVDAAQFVAGQLVTGVSGLTETFIKQRPLPASSTGLSASGGSGTGLVTVDDAALFLARFESGALGSFEATRFATGRKNALRLEVNGSLGSVAFDFESMNELQFYDGAEDPATAGFRRIYVTEPTHPYIGGWWPPGHGLGFEHSFTHEVVDLVRDLAQGHDPRPSFADGLQVQRVLAAVDGSAADEGRLAPIDDTAAPATPDQRRQS